MDGILLSSLVLPVIVGIVVHGINEKKWLKAYMPRKIKSGKRKNTVLLIGIGRVGKTQLVSYFTESNPLPQKITNEFSIHTTEKMYKKEKIQENIIIYFNDYRGQNFGQLVNSFIKEQLTPNTILRYGDINTLVLIVDIFPAEEDDLNIKMQYNEHSNDRIKEHLEAWNMYALDAVFALLERESLQFVCLFINKFDKLSYLKGKEEARKIILKEFDPLIDTLKSRAKGSTAEFQVIFGSAYSGEGIGGVGGLESRINHYSISEKNSKNGR